jgi:dTMP kinase
MFIMIEGTDGSGKSLQTEMLVKHLQDEKRPVQQISFPRYGERSATVIEDYLNGKFGSAESVGPYRASIFYAVDRYAASQQIRGWLDEGYIVIANRYVGSNMGHQGGKIPNLVERKKFFDWVYDLEYNIFQIPKPTINIILHVSPKTSQSLVDKKEARQYLEGKKRDIHEDDLLHLKNAEEAYINMASTFPEFKLIECEKNDALLPPEIIHQKIWAEISKNF